MRHSGGRGRRVLCREASGEGACPKFFSYQNEFSRTLSQDFIVLGLVPPEPTKSPIYEHQHAHPIRLATEPYTEIITPDRT